MMEKPPLIKRIAMGLTGNLSSVDDDNCPLVSDNNSNASTPGEDLYSSATFNNSFFYDY